MLIFCLKYESTNLRGLLITSGTVLETEYRSCIAELRGEMFSSSSTRWQHDQENDLLGGTVYIQFIFIDANSCLHMTTGPRIPRNIGYSEEISVRSPGSEFRRGCLRCSF
ncbi:hypothetical protein TNCT_632761 [Trichonephila clavata]|uniref:Uncharacterized protein n=1 Tax=Trichonephila clavata TaxID=2740835 RepID=A0A8X6LUR9_TRICU|nr:hypothetical protein TNCT_632761 [Trichonephila clavata]